MEVEDAEEDAEEDPVVETEAPLVLEPAGAVDVAAGVVRVTPTASQVCWAKAMALLRSSPWQVVSMHVVVEVMNDWVVHRHLLSVEEQPPRSADAMHVKAHAVSL